MSPSQAHLEAQLTFRQEQVESDKLSHAEAFGNLSDWTLTLGKRKAFLHPDWRQWLWYDRLHDEWVFAECGTAEGILVVVGKLGGVKKLPYFDKVEHWCVLLQQGQPLGPLQLEEVVQRMGRNELAPETYLWTPLRTEWLPASKPILEELLREKDRLFRR